MPGKIAEAFVDITANLKPLAAGLAQARASLGSFASAAGRLGSSAGSAFARGLASAVAGGAKAGLAALLVGGAAGGAALGYAIKQASDLNETVQAVDVTFGRFAGTVKDGADEMARAFGIPKTAFLEAAMGIGAIGKASGLTEDQAARLGVKFTKLAIDLSSMRNLPLEVALEKIRSGLVGEAEPLRAVGVLLSEAAVKAQAAKMGLQAVHGELTEGQKVMARAALITKQLADAHGDLARTADSVANQLREMRGRAQNTAAQLGQYLLPGVQALNKELLAMARDFDAAIGRNDARLRSWANKLKQVGEYVGIIYRNWSEFSKIARFAFKDLGRFLLDSFKSVFDYMVKWAEYFGEVIKRSIEDGMRAGMLAGGWKVGAAPQRQPLQAPQFQPAKWHVNANIKDLFGVIAEKEVGAKVRMGLGQAAQGLGQWAAGRRAKAAGAQAIQDQIDADSEVAQREAAARREDAARERKQRGNLFFHPGHGPGAKDVLGRPFLEAADNVVGRIERRQDNAWARMGVIAAPGPRALGQAAALGQGRDRLAQLAAKELTGMNAAQKEMRKQSIALAELDARAEGGDKAAGKQAKDLRDAIKEGAKTTEEFQAQTFSPAEWVKQIQLNALSKGKDPNQETATNTKRIADLLDTKVKDGNKILAVAQGLED